MRKSKMNMKVPLVKSKCFCERCSMAINQQNQIQKKKGVLDEYK